MSLDDRLVHVASETERTLAISLRGGEVTVQEGDTAVVLEVFARRGREVILRRGSDHFRGAVRVSQERILVSFGGHVWALERRASGGDASGEVASAADKVTSPMTGRVIQVCCRIGETVDEGAALVVVEAMKMEHKVLAPRPVSVGEILVSEGDQVDIGQVLVRFASEGPS